METRLSAEGHPLRAWESPTTRRDLLKQAGAAGAVLAGSSLLAACGSSASGATSGTVEFWDMLWGTSTYEPTARSLVAEYNRTHPGVTVNYRLIPWPNFYEVFATAVASGNTPDVSTGATYQAFQYANAIAPVNNVIQQWRADGTASDVIPASITAQVDAHGKMTGLPWCVDARPISYNKEIFKRKGVPVPRTFTELRQAAKALTGGGVYGFGFTGDTLGEQILVALFINNGGGVYSASCGPNLVNQRNREVCQLVQDMVTDGSIPKEAIGWASTDLASAVERGEIAICINEPAFWNTLTNGSVIDVMPPITGFHGDKGTILWYSAMWLYDSAKANKQHAIDFMNWWLGHEAEMWEKGGTTPLPVRKSFYKDTKVLEDPRVKLVVDEYLPVGKILSWPCSHALSTLNRVEGQSFLPTLAQNILGLKPIDASLSTAQGALAQLGSAA